MACHRGRDGRPDRIHEHVGSVEHELDLIMQLVTRIESDEPDSATDVRGNAAPRRSLTSPVHAVHQRAGQEESATDLPQRAPGGPQYRDETFSC